MFFFLSFLYRDCYYYLFILNHFSLETADATLRARALILDEVNLSF